MKPATGFSFCLLVALLASVSAKSPVDRKLRGLLRRAEDSGKDLRLVGGHSDNEGRVEVLHEGQWGTVCDDNFEQSETLVVCNSLGYYGGSHRPSAFFGEGSGQMWLDNVNCNGTEGTLADCSHDDWGNHDCSHAEDVGVFCYTEPQDYPDGEMRLVDGNDESSNQGYLMVFHNGEWGTVCDDGFNDVSAGVVCRYIGYNFGLFEEGAYDVGSGTIWMDEVRCSGGEHSLVECDRSPWGQTDCNHGEDVSIRCYN